MRPQEPPFGPPFGGQNRSKNRSEIGLLKKSLQDRPKTAQDRPKRPPGPPRSPQDAPPDPPGWPKMPSRIPLGRPKRLFRSTWPSTFFRRGSLYNGRRKNRKIRNRRKQVEKKVDNGHPRWSFHTIPHKSRKNFHNGRTPRGWRRWSREALFNPPPPAQHGTACCKVQVEDLFDSN